MFEEFYQLREQPFGSNPDPRFLYLSRTHREAFSSLYYRLQAESGFMAMIAEPGMGKTTLLFHLLHHLQPAARTAFIFQTQCDSCELQRQLLSEFNCDPAITDRVRMQQEFKTILLREANAGRACVAIIDEAQNLGSEVLETVRLLSNFETPRRKLLQIVLSGQRELGEMLNSPELHQLRQRLSCVVRIQRFGPDETVQYIAHRLAIAGFSGRLSSLFDLRALLRITQASNGIPRVINNICFNALSLGFATGKSQIHVEVIDEVVNDLGLAGGSATSSHETAADQFLIAALERSVAEIGERATSRQAVVSSANATVSCAASSQCTEEAAAPANSRDLRQPLTCLQDSSVLAREIGRCNPSGEPDGNVANHADAEAEQPAAVEVATRRRLAFFGRRSAGDRQGTVSAHRAKFISWGIVVLVVCTTPALRSPAHDRSTGRASEVASRRMPFSSPETSTPVPLETVAQGAPTNSGTAFTPPSSDLRAESVIQHPKSATTEKQIGSKRDRGPDKVSARTWKPRLVLATQQLQSDEMIGSVAGPRVEDDLGTAVSNRDATVSDAPINLLPKPIADPPPVYPARAQQLNVAGEVLLLISVSASGDVASVQLLRGNAMLAAAAEEAVKRWKYSPALFDGTPTDSRVFVAFQFKLQ
jgi:general secretion pathway protein A